MIVDLRNKIIQTICNVTIFASQGNTGCESSFLLLLYSLRLNGQSQFHYSMKLRGFDSKENV